MVTGALARGLHLLPLRHMRIIFKKQLCSFPTTLCSKVTSGLGWKDAFRSLGALGSPRLMSCLWIEEVCPARRCEVTLSVDGEPLHASDFRALAIDL